MKKLLLILFLLAGHLNSFSSSAYGNWWQKANQLYSTKLYDSAANYYEKIAAQSPDDARVFFNLGNTYYKLNQIGPAVLNYERALKIDPNYKEAQDNLYLTQNRISNRISSIPDIFFVQWWHSWTSAKNSGTLSVIAWIFFLLLLAAVGGKMLRKANTPPQLTAALIVLWLCFLYMAYVASDNKVRKDQAVVMDADVPFLNGPQAGKSQSLIPEGTVVNIEAERSGWTQIKLPDGREGWLSDKTIAKF